MKDALRPVFVLLVAVVFLMAGTGPLTTLIGVRLELAQESTVVIGIVMAAYFAGLTIGSLQTFRLVTRIGHIRAFAVFASVMAACTLAYPVLPDTWAWGLLRLAQGFCMAGLFVCIESWLNDSATTRTRGTILAAYMTFLYLAQAAGQFILQIADPTGFLLFVIMGILLCFAVVPVAMTRMTPPLLPDISSLSFKRLYAASPLGIFGCVSSGLILGAVYSLAPVYASGIGFNLSQTATFMSVMIFGGVLLQWPLGWLSDVLDRRKVIVGVIAAGLLTSVSMIVAAGAGLATHMLLIGIYGGMAFVLYPLCVAHTNDHLEREERIGASGGLVLSYSAGATLGPPVAATMMSAIGPSGLFLFTTIIGIASIGFAAWRLSVRAPVPADRQGPFQTLPRTTPVAAPLDPRGEADHAGAAGAQEIAGPPVARDAGGERKVEEPA